MCPTAAAAAATTAAAERQKVAAEVVGEPDSRSAADRLGESHVREPVRL